MLHKAQPPDSHDEYWDAPEIAHRVNDEDYWKGVLVDANGSQDQLRDLRIVSSYDRSGSVSAQARKLYASEALRSKDHVAAGLLAIFLGVFGVHKFYLGCNQAGFVMLAVTVLFGIFTFWLAAIMIWCIAIMEGVIYLTRSQSSFDELYVVNQRDWF